MGNPPPPDAWKRLGRALELRRGQLGYGYGRRGRFARDRGAQVSVKTIARLERGERESYPAATMAAFETLYGLVPGSLETSLATGTLKVAEIRGPDPLNYPPGPLRRIAADPDLEADEKWGLIELAERMRDRQNGQERRRA